MKKKIICCILALIVVVSGIVISATTVDNNTLSFGVYNTPTGSGYEVKVIINSDYLCAGMQSVIGYDTNKLVYVGATDNEAVNVSNGKIKVSSLTNDVQNGQVGKLFELKFMSREYVFSDAFTFSKVKGVAVKNNSIFSSEDTYVFDYADCNKDKAINVLDLVRMKKMAAGNIQKDLSADLDNDCDVSSTDLISMSKILLGAFKSDADSKVLNVADFGAIGDGVTDDSKAIKNAVAALSCSEDNTVLNFESGKTYYVSSKKTGITKPIELSNTQNKIVNGNDSTIIFDRDMSYMGMYNCSNITVKGLNFDLKERSHFVGEVKSVNVNEGYFEVVSDRDFGFDGEYIPSKSMFGLTDTGSTTSRVYIVINKISTVDKESLTYRIYPGLDGDYADSLASADHFKQLKQGAKVILPTPEIGHCGGDMIHVFDNTDVSFEDINVWNSREFVWVLRRNKGEVSFKNVNVMPPKDESVCFSSWRDAFHCRDNSAAITWDNCTVKGNGDDIFNLSTSMMYINEVVAPNEVVCYWPETKGSYGNPAVGSEIVIWNADTYKIIARTTLKEVVDSKTNHYILNDNIAGLAAGENIRFCFESDCAPNSKIINCDLDGTLRFRGGPLTVKDSTINLKRMWIEYEGSMEGPIPHDIEFNNCAFTTYNNAILIDSHNKHVICQTGDYKLENIKFTNCTGLTKNAFQNKDNFIVSSPDYVTFSPALK